MKKYLNLFLIAILLCILFIIPSNSALASTDDIKSIRIIPKHNKLEPGSDSLYYGNVYLSQKFSADITTYTATVENDIENVKLEINTTGNVTITVNDNYDLNVGENKISIVVTKPDGTAKTYTIVITRNASQNDNNNLKFMSITGTDKNGEDLILMDTVDASEPHSKDLVKFQPSVATYGFIVDNYISEIDVFAIPEVDVAKVEYKTSYKLKTGQNKIKIKVISKSGLENTYTVNVERKASSDSSLVTIKVNDDDIYVNKKSYTVNVLYDTKVADISVVANNNATTVKGLGKHKLKVGNNTIKLTAIAEDGSQTIYTIKVVRAKPSTGLASLNINEYYCGTEDSTIYLDVKYEDTKAIITAKAVDKSAKVSGNGTYKLKVGKNKFYITVKAIDGKTKKYTITVNRLKQKKYIIIYD